MNINDLLTQTVQSGASDLHITVAVPPIVRVNGELKKLSGDTLMPDMVAELVRQMLTDEQMQKLNNDGEIDFSYANQGLGRFRVNAFKQRGSYGIVCRVVALTVPDMDQLGLPQVVKTLAQRPRGLILVTGPTGSGKSTTLASMIDYINHTQSAHILTLEDPIEYLHWHDRSIVNQREMGNDSQSYSAALRAALRQDPDVILVGEMRDLETIAIAVTAAETGHLVLSTLHTIGAAKTVDRIIDVFPPAQQAQIRVQLAGVLEGVVSQLLLPRRDIPGRVAAFEIMVSTPALRNLIREGKTHQMQATLQTGAKFGMCTMDNSLAELYRQNIVSRDEVIERAQDRELLERMLGY